jgi:hypothetical protein
MLNMGIRLKSNVPDCINTGVLQIMWKGIKYLSGSPRFSNEKLFPFHRMWIAKVCEFHYWLLLSVLINFVIRAVYKCIVFYCRC